MNPPRALTRSELIVRLAARNPRLAARDADEAVKLILDVLGAALSQGGRIEIRGFGSFSLNYRPARLGRNPKSGECVRVPAKFVPHFKAGKELRARVDIDVSGSSEPRSGVAALARSRRRDGMRALISD